MSIRAAVIAFTLFGGLGCQRERAQPAPAPSARVARTPAAGALPASEPRLDAALHLPELAPGARVPLLVMLHGLGASAEQIETSSDWLAFAGHNGIAWLAPNGPFDRHGRRFWDAGPSCCNFDHLPVDHVAALAELIQRTVASAAIDPERVYVGGHSNGAFMAHRLACARPDLVRGVVAISGVGPATRSECRTPGALRVLQIHGDSDPIVPYAGGHLFGNSGLPETISAEETVAGWASALGCTEAPVSRAAVDLEQALPGPETRVRSFPHCRAGKLELWTVVGGSHYIGFRAPAPAAIWTFFRD